MRGKRSKQYKKLMQQYGLVFGFREPYQVLVDAQMIQDADRFTMDLVVGLERVLHGKVKPMITQCSIRHLYMLSSISQPHKDAIILRAKSMERRRCNHHLLEQPLSTLECLSSIIDPKGSRNNRHRYVVASQDDEVRKYCRAVKGVPLIYVKRSVMVMEPMAESSLGAREGFEKGKFRSGIRGKAVHVAQKRKREEGESTDDENAEAPQGGLSSEDARAKELVVKKKKAKGPKGPNPLSAKKPRTIQALAPTNSIATLPKEVSQPSVSEEGLEPAADTTNIHEAIVDEVEGQVVKRKRRRKHKPSKLAELLQA